MIDHQSESACPPHGRSARTPAESRRHLSSLREQAIAAGLTSVVSVIDIRLAIASELAIKELEKALAAIPPSDAVASAHSAIVERLDSAEPAPLIAAPRRPVLGASRPAPAPPPSAPRSLRKPTGPDKYDLEIPL